jgi:regulator of cell morphogenesis and NO signaling
MQRPEESAARPANGPCLDTSVTLGELVTRYPKTAQVFKRYGIDFCCGGKRPLRVVLAESGLSEEELASQLREAFAGAEDEGEAPDWTKRSFAELIDHIVSVHHGYLYRELPEIGQYVVKIDHVHGGRHPELAQVRDLFARMRQELMIHLPKEEMDLFPAIKRLEQEPSAEQRGRLTAMVEALEDEHESCGEILKQIRSVTNDYAVPDDACATYRLTFQKLQELESDLFQHIHLENNVLFPCALNFPV